MKKRIVSFLLAALLSAALLPAAVFAAAIQTNSVVFTVEQNAEAGLAGDITITFTGSRGNYTGTLYLPGNVNIDQLTMSWPEELTVKKSGDSCLSGKEPVPAKGESSTYAVTSGRTTANYTVSTMQGSADVAGMFLTIDETRGTIEDMNADTLHETECRGTASFEGKDYFISMKGRGNATWEKDKKPYNITFYKGNEDDAGKKKVSLIKGVESKKWSLLANYLDNSRLRNKIGYDLAKGMGVGLDSRYIDLWMNGQYIGNYLVTPKSDYQVTDEGFILELDNYKEPEGGDPQFTLEGLTETTITMDPPRYNRFTVKATGDDLTLDTDGIHAWMQEAFGAIEEYDSERYLEYIDLDSWAKVYLLNEFYKNYDIIAGSILMHRDGTAATDKLMAGPVWDLDNAIGRVNVCPHNGVSKDRFDSDGAQRSADNWYLDRVGTYKFQSSIPYVCWMQELGKHESFMTRVCEIYNEYQTTINSVNGSIDTQAELLESSARMDHAKWSSGLTGANDYIRSKATYGSKPYAITYVVTSTWDDAVANLKTYVSTRLKFLSDHLAVPVPAGGEIQGTTDLLAGETLRLTVDTEADRIQWQSSADGIHWEDIEGADTTVYSVTADAALVGRSVRCVARNVGSKAIETQKVASVVPDAVTVFPAVALRVRDYDINGDESVDAGDLETLARHFAQIQQITEADKVTLADFNGDGTVNVADLTALAVFLQPAQGTEE